MENYKFLIKPVFFIINIFFATWLVFTIEEINPSDFGMRDESKKIHKPDAITMDRYSFPKHSKTYLKKICADYKAGLLDSAGLERELNAFLTSPEKMKNTDFHYSWGKIYPQKSDTSKNSKLSDTNLGFGNR